MVGFDSILPAAGFSKSKEKLNSFGGPEIINKLPLLDQCLVKFQIAKEIGSDITAKKYAITAFEYSVWLKGCRDKVVKKTGLSTEEINANDIGAWLLSGTYENHPKEWSNFIKKSYALEADELQKDAAKKAYEKGLKGKTYEQFAKEAKNENHPREEKFAAMLAFHSLIEFDYAGAQRVAKEHGLAEHLAIVQKISSAVSLD